MTSALLAADTLPEGDGYVVAAYLVFVALILVYVGIMAAKLVRLDRDLQELNELADRLERDDDAPDAPVREEARA